MASLWRLVPWIRRRRAEREIRRELELHLTLETRQNRERGMGPAEAARAARAALGNIPLIAEDARAVWGWAWLDALVLDVRVALRLIRILAAGHFPGVGHARIDAGAIGLTLALVLVTVLACGVAPALRGTRARLSRHLRAEPSTNGALPGATADSRRLRDVLLGLLTSRAFKLLKTIHLCPGYRFVPLVFPHAPNRIPSDYVHCPRTR